MGSDDALDWRITSQSHLLHALLRAHTYYTTRNQPLVPLLAPTSVHSTTPLGIFIFLFG
jgi:hypothetical protein